MVAFLKSPLYTATALIFSYAALAQSGTHVEGKSTLLPYDLLLLFYRSYNAYAMDR